MKRFLQILGFLILLLLVAAFVLPIVFKDEIVARAKQEINNTLTATVDFKDIDISLFRSFPDFSMDIEEITIDGQNEFEGTRLAEVEHFRVDLALFSVISGNQFEVEAITIDKAKVIAILNEEGMANYDIVKKSGTTNTDTTTTEPANFELTLKSLTVNDGHVLYHDKKGDIKMVMKDVDFSGSGDLTQEVVNLDTKTTVESFTLETGGIAYLENTRVIGDMLFEFIQPEFKITFKENVLTLNDLKLNFEGYMAMPSDDIDMDLAFTTPESDFKNILSLIPTIYAQDFKDVQTSGNFTLNGKVDGVYNYKAETYPTFDVNFNIENGTFKYPNLPSDVKSINLTSHIYNNTTDLDGTVIDVPSANAIVAGSPITARLNLKTPISDPQFSTFLKTDFELDNIGKVVPAEGFDYSGHIKADLDIAARMSDIDNERYENVKAEGQFLAENVDVRNDSLPFPVKIPRLQMDFSPQTVALNSLEANLGNSDISANGNINNLLSYMLQDKTLQGEFTVNSQLLDLNELTSATGGGSANSSTSQSTSGNNTGTSDTSKIETLRIPENIDFKLTATVDKVLYDNLEINDVKGNVNLKEGEARVENLVMNLLGGSLALNGGYNSRNSAPEVDMNFKINNFGFRESFKKLVTIKKLVPIMQNTSGNYSTGFSFVSKLNPDMSPDLSTILASGSLLTEKLKTSPKVLEKLSGLLQNPSLASLDIGKVNLNFKVEDGRVKVEPFNLNAGKVSAVVEGSNGLDQTLDYTMNMKLPVSGIKADNLLSKVGAVKGGKIDLAVKITGTYTDPKISTSLGDILGGVINNIKDKVDEVKQDAINEVNVKAQELIDAASAKGDQLIAAARDQAERIRSLAQAQSTKLIAEADTSANKLEEEAKGNFLKEKGAKIAADKLRSEAKEKADGITNTANKKADDLVNKAIEQKEKLIEEAREKGKIENS